MQFGDRCDGLSHRHADVGEPLRRALLYVVEVGVVLQHAGVDLEIGDAARERIGRSLKDEGRARSGIGHLACGLFAVGFRDDLALGGGGRVPFRKNFSMRASLPSATSATSASWAVCAASARSAGMSLSLPLPSPSGVQVEAFMRMRSTTPLKSRSAPMGIWTGMAVRPKVS